MRYQTVRWNDVVPKQRGTPGSGVASASSAMASSSSGRPFAAVKGSNAAAPAGASFGGGCAMAGAAGGRPPAVARTGSSVRGGRTAPTTRLDARGCCDATMLGVLESDLIRVAGVQLENVVGDLTGNAERILDAMRWAEEQDADVVVFPELALTGYPLPDLVLREEFV